MSDNFDWQAEDDDLWDQLPADDGNDQRSRKPRRWPFVLLVLLLLAGAGAVIFREINQRVETNSEAMRADILSSHNLKQIADEEGDEELFYSILSGRDEGWTAAQNDLFEAGLLQDRTPFGLSMQKDKQTASTADEESTDITFSADMLEAEMVMEQPYTVEIGSGLTETITLQETSVYRLGRERWLLAPPTPEFWGERDSVEGARLRISFSARDEEWATRMLPDLERKLDEACRTLLDISCDAQRMVEIQLSPDPAALASTAAPQPAKIIDDKLSITLPTPTLVGLPIDDAGYQALFRGYASQMVSALISSATGYACCDQLPLYQALIEYQLNQLSLKPWPVAVEDYERLRDEQVQLADLADLWRSEDLADLRGDGGWRYYAVVDYLLQASPEISPIDLQQEMVRRGSFFGWLNGVFSGENETANADLHSDLMRQFWLQAYPQATRGGGEFAVAPPDQDLQVICEEPQLPGVAGIRLSTLFRYDLRDDVWQKEYETNNYLFMSPLADDEALILLEYLPDSGQWRTSLQREGQSIPLLADAAQSSVSFGQTDPSGTDLLAFVFSPDGRNADITLFDLASCSIEQGCTGQILPGVPVWSSDGSQAVFGDQPNMQLGLLYKDRGTILFDSSAPTRNLAIYHAQKSEFMEGEPVTELSALARVGEGHAPFWLDEETIAYVTLGEGRSSRPAQEVAYTPAGDDAPQTLFDVDDLAEAMQDVDVVERLLWIQYVMVHPQDPDLLLVAAFGAWDQQAHLLSYRRDTGELEHLMQAGYMSNHTLSVSPDGRFVLMTGNDASDPDRDRDNMLLQIHDLSSGETVPFMAMGTEFPPFPTYDWSADGRWLAMMLDQNLIGLYGPAEGALHLIETEPGGCTTPSWVNR